MSDRLKLDAVLDLQATGRLAAQLQSLAGPVELDASEVRHLGALAAQLLLSAITRPRAVPFAVRVVAPSSLFCECAQRLGIAPDLLTA